MAIIELQDSRRLTGPNLLSPDPGAVLPGCPAEPSAWAELYHGTGGQVLGLAMYVVLAIVVFLLARWGANKDMEERGAG